MYRLAEIGATSQNSLENNQRVKYLTHSTFDKFGFDKHLYPHKAGYSQFALQICMYLDSTKLLSPTWPNDTSVPSPFWGSLRHLLVLLPFLLSLNPMKIHYSHFNCTGSKLSSDFVQCFHRICSSVRKLHIK
jgi:hypothetical protein